MPRGSFKPNTYRIEEDTAVISLTQGKETVIDLEDLDRVLKHSWHAVNVARRGDPPRFYARSGSAGFLQRFIIDAAPHSKVDHEDGDTFNNRKSNLRGVTNQQNVANRHGLDSRSTSGIRGVAIHRDRKTGREYWRAMVAVAKYFPLSDEGKTQAEAEVLRLRNALYDNGFG